MKDRNYAIAFVFLRQYPHITKEDIALKYSSGRSSSLKDLTDEEYLRMCRDLGGSEERKEELRKARSSVLHLLQSYGIDTLDWTRINAFCAQPRIAGKPFGALSVAELRKLSTKLRSMIAKKRKAESSKLKEIYKRLPWQPQGEA